MMHIMKYGYILVTVLILSACSTYDKQLNQNYRMIDQIIQNPDTLKVIYRDTIVYPNPKYPPEYRDVWDKHLEWFKERAECLRKYGYNIVQERLINFDDSRVHQIQIQCKNNSKDIVLSFIYSNKKGYWKFQNISGSKIGEHPIDGEITE